MARKKTRGKRSRKTPGMESVWLLAAKPVQGKAPTHFLIDHTRYPADGPLTSQVSKARKWSDSSGPRQFFRLHPDLRRRFVSFKLAGALDAPAPSRRMLRKSAV
jgi:hypothetical protein